MLKEPEIEEIVSRFYQLALADVLIGYQFRKIDDFPAHVTKIASFWKNQLYPELFPPVAAIRFNAKHFPLNLHTGELGRWIVLFEQTLDQWSAINGEAQEVKRWKERIEIFKQMLLGYPAMFSQMTK